MAVSGGEWRCVVGESRGLAYLDDRQLRQLVALEEGLTLDCQQHARDESILRVGGRARRESRESGV